MRSTVTHRTQNCPDNLTRRVAGPRSPTQRLPCLACGTNLQRLGQRALLGRGTRGCAKALLEHSTVVDTAWLRRNLEGDIRIFDARGSAGLQPGPEASGQAEGGAEAGADGSQRGPLTADYDGYLEGHVPGAVFVNWTRDGARYVDVEGEEQSESGGWRRQLPRPEGCGGGRRVLAAESDPDTYVPCFEARGLSAEPPVVVYDDGSSMTAARVWWSLVLYGQPQPYILAGGWDAWRAGGGASELYEPCPLKLSTTFEAEPQPQYRASAEEFVAAAEQAAAATAAAGPGPVAVLVLPEGMRSADAGPLPPGLRTVTLSQLLPSSGSPSVAGVGGAGSRLLAEAAIVALSEEGQRRELQQTLRARLGSALGIRGLGDGGSGSRLLMASPGDAAVSACVLGAVLWTAGHSDWAVCDAL